MKKMMIIILIILIIGGLFFGCIENQLTTQESKEKIQVMASFYPFYDIAKNIVGEKANVSVLVPPGSEPHSFNPSPQDILRVSKADIFIVTGTEFEEWEERIVENVNSSARLVKANKGIELLLAENKNLDTNEHKHNEHEDDEHEDGEHEDDEHEDGEHEDDEHLHGLYDPHFWVSPINVIKIIDNLTETLVESDPKNASYYLENSINYKNEIMSLHGEFQLGLVNCEKNKIITTHAAFAYLGKNYGFEQIHIFGLSPENEPTTGQIIKLIDVAKLHDLNYIFYEEMIDSRISQTIASEVGAETLVLNPIAGSKDEKSYIEIMQQNLVNLKIGLECN
jgi:zinc transport system substrate-binding protein